MMTTTVLRRQAAERAAQLGVSFDFVWIDLNWRALVPVFNCGHPFEFDDEVHIVHVHTPRYRGDWAREHARNVRLLCSACQKTKGERSYEQWLDDMNMDMDTEAAR